MCRRSRIAGSFFTCAFGPGVIRPRICPAPGSQSNRPPSRWSPRTLWLQTTERHKQDVNPATAAPAISPDRQLPPDLTNGGGGLQLWLLGPFALVYFARRNRDRLAWFRVPEFNPAPSRSIREAECAPSDSGLSFGFRQAVGDQSLKLRSMPEHAAGDDEAAWYMR